MMQIHVDPTTLTQEQREAVAGFLLAFPQGAIKDQVVDLRVDAQTAAAVTANPVGASHALHSAVADLARDAELPPTPVEAFGLSSATPADAAAAFGAPTPFAPASTDTTPPSTPAGCAPAAVTALTPPTHGHASSAAPAAPGVADRDAAGLPWDARIHASSKAKIADGTWRKKKNLDPAVFASVEAELRQLMSASVPAAPAAPVAPVATPVPPVSLPPVAMVNTAPAGSMSSIAATVEANMRQQYVALVGRASAAAQAGKISADEITAVCKEFGIAALPLLSSRLDLVDAVAQRIDALIASRP